MVNVCLLGQSRKATFPRDVGQRWAGQEAAHGSHGSYSLWSLLKLQQLQGWFSSCLGPNLKGDLTPLRAAACLVPFPSHRLDHTQPYLFPDAPPPIGTGDSKALKMGVGLYPFSSRSHNTWFLHSPHACSGLARDPFLTLSLCLFPFVGPLCSPGTFI